MRNLSDYSGINVFMGTSTTLSQIPAASKNNALFMHFNDYGKLIEIVYHDALGHAIRIPEDQADIKYSLGKIYALARERSLDLDLKSGQMLHLNPSQIQEVFPSFLDNYIYTEEKYAEIFFKSHPQGKFNRKTSGLAHSYRNDAQEGIIQSTHKNETRAMWSKTIPTQAIFANFPENTSGAYVIVQPAKDVSPVLYYLPKKPGERAKEVTKKPDLTFFNAYRFNNRGLSKEDLEYIPKTLHQTDKTNVYGAGGTARVKKATARKYVSTKFATKIQKLKKEGTFKSQKTSARDSEIAKIQREARIVSDLQLGSSDVQISGDKAYMNMLAKGTPLSKKLTSASSTQKLDYAIKFLIAVDRLHTGTGPAERASLTHTPYAHRDLKPDNVLVDEFGEFTLIDYGLSTPNITSKTEENGGTLFYAPLDQNIINHYTKANIPQPFIVTNSADPDLALKKIDSQFSDDDELEDWTIDVDMNAVAQSANENSTNVNPEISLPQNWTYCLVDPTKCITTNYLEEDKIAALRTIYTSCPIATAEDSIFNDEDFADLPDPIREILNSDTIAPLLSPERRHETESFFAAVLIMYQQNPHRTNNEYQQIIETLRHDPAQQRATITEYLDVPKENKLKRRVISPVNMDDVNTVENDYELEHQMNLNKKLKPKDEGSFSEKKTVWQRVKQNLMGKRSASITPINVDESSTENEDHNKNNKSGL